MRPLARALLLGGSMAVSAVSIALGSACYDMQTCPFNECAAAWYPDGGGTCCGVDRPWFYSCDVTLEGKPPNVNVYNDVTVGGCYSSADEAEGNAPYAAETEYAAEYPNTVGRSVRCSLSQCPGGGT